MSLLTAEELEQLAGAETLFRSPIPVQSLSSDEFMPAPQSPKQCEFEARVKDIGARLAKRNGMTRRRFFQTAVASPLVGWVGHDAGYIADRIAARAPAANPPVTVPGR